MFSECLNLSSAADIPDITGTVGDYAFQFLYSGCTSLTAAPEIHASKTGKGSHREMFQNCSNLVVPPTTLSATVMYRGAFAGLFKNCSSLTAAPTLPATSFSDQYQYQEMFLNCTSLSTPPPELPATTLTQNCYI